MLWMCPARAGRLTLVVQPAAGGAEVHLEAAAEEHHDLCVAMPMTGLSPATAYVFRFEHDGAVIGRGSFRTWALPETPARVSLALGSCAYTESSPVWTRMLASGCDALLLMGDTPDIDSYDLTTARRRHREFLHIPELRPLLAGRPVWRTWDDHDFGLNADLGDAA